MVAGMFRVSARSISLSNYKVENSVGKDPDSGILICPGPNEQSLRGNQELSRDGALVSTRIEERAEREDQRFPVERHPNWRGRARVPGRRGIEHL
jgi:hypothetical protein